MGLEKWDTESNKGKRREDRPVRRDTGNGERLREGGSRMKGYYVNEGYMGYVDGGYRLFADESDYLEMMRDEN